MGYNFSHSDGSNHSKARSFKMWTFLSGFQMVDFRVSYPIQNPDYCKPTSFWPRLLRISDTHCIAIKRNTVGIRKPDLYCIQMVESTLIIKWCRTEWNLKTIQFSFSITWPDNDWNPVKIRIKQNWTFLMRLLYVHTM